MYPQLQIWRPIVAMAALVTAALFATSTVDVASGDTLSTIAERHDVSVAELIAWNDIDNPDRIFVGDRLVVAAPSATPVSASPTAHVVTAGDTLSGIARRLGSSIGALVAANNLSNPDRIYIGQRIVAGSTPTTPTTTAAPAQRTHTVVSGDTLSSIAASFGTKVGFIARDNHIDNPNQIRVGTVLVINQPEASPPAATATPTPAPTTPTTPSTDSSGSTTRRPNEVLLAPMFEHWASTYNVPQDLLQAIAWQESNWRPDAVSPGGHVGIMQISPGTATFIQQNLLGKSLDPLTANDGLQMGARFLRYLLDRTENETEAIAAWRQGLHSVTGGGITTAGAQYVARVEEIRAQWA